MTAPSARDLGGVTPASRPGPEERARAAPKVRTRVFAIMGADGRFVRGSGYNGTANKHGDVSTYLSETVARKALLNFLAKTPDPPQMWHYGVAWLESAAVVELKVKRVLEDTRITNATAAKEGKGSSDV